METLGKIDLHIHTAASDGLIDLSQAPDKAGAPGAVSASGEFGRADIPQASGAFGRADAPRTSDRAAGQIDAPRAYGEGPDLWRGYRLVAITDHEHIFDPSAYAPGRFGAARAMAGVEICCHHKGRNMEILGYDFDPKDPALNALVQRIRNLRIAKLTEILQENGLSTEGLPQNPCRLHVRLPSGVDPAAFWNRYNAAYKAQNHSVPAQTVIETVLAAGGVPVFAHPMESLAGMESSEVEAFILSLGVQTVELITPKHTAAEVAMIGAILDRHGLSASIGSDSHQATLRDVGHPYDLRDRRFAWIRARL